MYILYKLEKRAETTDTILFCACASRAPLEEIILSLLEEMYDKDLELAEWGEVDILPQNLWDYCKYRMKSYDIVYVPEIQEG